MQTNSLQKINNVMVFRDFHPKNGVLCRNFPEHGHVKDNSVNSFKQPETKGHGQVQTSDENGSKTGIKKAAPLIGAIIGTILPIVLINTFEKKSLNLKALKGIPVLDKLKEISSYFEIDNAKMILSTAAGAISGGLAGGFLVDKNKENRKEKIKEGIFEMMNISIPTVLAATSLKLMKSKGLNKGAGKLVPFIFGVGAGIPVASKVSKTISKYLFKEDDSKQRKFKPSDFLVHIDDMVEALVLLNFPIVKKLQIDKILALIYMKCGYEAGSKDENSKGHHHH